MFEQALWRAGARQPGGAVGAFGQLAWADGSVSDIDRHGSAGLAWTGPIPGRESDVLGAMVSTVRFTSSPAAAHIRRRETALEAFYNVQLVPWAALQADFQVVANPGGQNIRRAVVGTARLEVAF